MLLYLAILIPRRDDDLRVSVFRKASSYDEDIRDNSAHGTKAKSGVVSDFSLGYHEDVIKCIRDSFARFQCPSYFLLNLRNEGEIATRARTGYATSARRY